jgi:small subunit ribosomal protein S18
MPFKPFRSFKSSKTGIRRRSAARRAVKRYGEQTKCRFCRMRIQSLDYKDIPTLMKLITAQGKLFSRKRSGNCTEHQHSAKRAIKYARYLALVPYVG